MQIATPPDREAPAEHPIEAAIRRRWSPRSYAETPVSASALNSLLEAARWSASCFNAQPWNFIVCRKAEDAAAFDKLFGCLSVNNQGWAGKAPVLILAVARTTFPADGSPNRYAWYDTGAAVANLAIQAGPLGLQIHSMAGFDAAKAREAFGIGEGFDPVAAISVGYPCPADALPEALKARETGPRVRRTVAEIAQFGGWKQP
jgi:nitroreductase